MSLFREFWWSSSLSRMDTRDAIAQVRTRPVRGPLLHTQPPEEVTTFNLVRRLTRWRRKEGGVGVALHSRSLEGGHAPSGRLPSGVDLELAVEVAPGRWLDLALQAKRFFPLTELTGRYNGWSTSQNLDLINWSKGNGARNPGMLLYNTEHSPFAGPQDTSIVFAGCCETPNTCHGWQWPRWTLPDHRTPMAVSLTVDQRAMRFLTAPTPEEIAPNCIPLECIFCPNAPTQSKTLSRAPAWAEVLVEESGDSADEVDDTPSEELLDDDGRVDSQAQANETAPAFSVVLGMSDDERAAFS